ncbi:hypothetical protein [Streptacidiphilus melanogenes]|uniref:hypothetical protein n=1 Tax=Streptacidiphilus melanogenes TaxID=411235 RepID=UPI0005A7EC2B|nr:hypothetical protein [Streptacidiphilus melanogenes]
MTGFKQTLVYQSTFYANGRRLLRLSGPRIDAMIHAGATARLEGSDVTITAPGMDDYCAVDVTTRRTAAAWVKKFNDRARQRQSGNDGSL